MSQNQIANLSEAMPVNQNSGVFSSIQRFNESYQMASCLADSDLVPKAYLGKPQNCLIALNMAERMDSDPMMVMQNLHVIRGRPSFSAQFLVACVNRSGRFSTIQYEKVNGDKPETFSYEYWVNKVKKTGSATVVNDKCRAFATELKTGVVIYGPWASMEMAVKEQWYSKAGSKWQTMPELMLEYRAAAFFVRTKAPEIAMGMQTTEELKDMGDAVVVHENEAAPTVNVKDLEQLIQGDTTPESELKTEESEAPMITFYKQSIDSCSDLETLTQCGQDIADKVGELSESGVLEVKRYLNDKIKAAKAQADDQAGVPEDFRL